MTQSRINCWQYMRCGREPGGARAAELGVCPAAVDASFDGINAGTCAGRFCWAVSGTLCGGKRQGTFARKRATCLDCTFYQRVQFEEGTANLRTKFLRFITPEGSLLKGLEYRLIRRGTRFLVQGEAGAHAFIIQRGACMEVVEKDGALHPIAHRGEGDVVGILTLLTGEPETAHVEAETDMEVWAVDRARFEDLTRREPELLAFLTELVAERFDSRRPTAERTIGPYVATEIIGRGGYSIVYKGLDARTGRSVAIKMLRHHMALQPDFLDSFRREARVIAGLEHENILRVYDTEERYRTVFIVMEHLEGRSLKDLLARQGRLAPEAAVGFLQQACAAMAYADRKGLVHRDIHPGNMMVMPGGRLKLIDFGLACAADAEGFEETGTLAYQAPEILNGEPAGRLTDIYALGITAYELVTGTTPHAAGDAQAFFARRRTEEIPDPGEAVADLPLRLREFVQKACRRDPAGRYPDAAHALAALAAIGAGKGPAAPAAGGRADLLQTPLAAAAVRSHTGRVRPTNQDRCWLHAAEDGSVFLAVADGLGGDPYGEEAADMVLAGLPEAARVGGDGEPGGAERRLAELVRRLDARIDAVARRDPDRGGMGSTLVLVRLSAGRASWVHVGDSRLYLLREGVFSQVTQDQTLSRFLLAEGALTAEEACGHYSCLVPDQYVGCGYCEPETGSFALRAGDVLLLATDGLHRFVAPGALAALMNSPGDAGATADNLLRAALAAGGEDNVTALVAKVAPGAPAEISPRTTQRDGIPGEAPHDRHT
jgi:serine/threonine protein phosphatase PrpC/CRP-like cAMP-binding protein